MLDGMKLRNNTLEVLWLLRVGKQMGVDDSPNLPAIHPEWFVGNMMLSHMLKKSLFKEVDIPGELRKR